MAEEKQSGHEGEILKLYKATFPLVAQYISRMGGSLEEAKDIFHDAIVIYYEKQADVIPALKYSEKAYLYGIAKNIWHYRLRSNKENAVTNPDSEAEIDNFYNDEPVFSKLAKVLDSAGKKCMELLSAFYYDKLNMKEIAARFNFSGERSATVQKYKCLEKVKNVVKQKSLQYEDFFE